MACELRVFSLVRPHGASAGSYDYQSTCPILKASMTAVTASSPSAMGRADWASALVVIVIWGLNFVVIKVGRQDSC